MGKVHHTKRTDGTVIYHASGGLAWAEVTQPKTGGTLVRLMINQDERLAWLFDDRENAEEFARLFAQQ